MFMCLLMYVYIYIYIYIYMCIHIYIYVCIYIYTHTYMSRRSTRPARPRTNAAPPTSAPRAGTSSRLLVLLAEY